MQKDRSLMPLGIVKILDLHAIVRIRTLNLAVTIDVRSHSAIVAVLDENWCLHNVYIH